MYKVCLVIIAYADKGVRWTLTTNIKLLMLFVVNADTDIDYHLKKTKIVVLLGVGCVNNKFFGLSIKPPKKNLIRRIKYV